MLAQTSPESPFATLEIDADVAAETQATYPRYALSPATEIVE